MILDAKKILTIILRKTGLGMLYLLCCGPLIAQPSLPRLTVVRGRPQLIVDSKPFLILGGELGNSTATSLENMAPVWPRLKAMNLNTVLMPVYWELVEPVEGQFDFSLYRDLILEARKSGPKLVFLWFGVWKNSMSSHVPAWIKLNTARFPRAKSDQGISQEILSAFSEPVLQADIKAFEALMAFVKEVDIQDHTVIMVQVENEVGMLPSARDHQALAQAAFIKPVPSVLMNYLVAHQKELPAELAASWQTNGQKLKGTWIEVFGVSPQTEEYFMAFQYSSFLNRLAAAGKRIYPLPMYANAALNRPGRLPGEYPSAGPLPHLLDIWKGAGHDLDFLSPDFYNPDFKQWCDAYTRQGDPLFIPEHAFDATAPVKALYSIGHYDGLGFSPFSIESKNENSESLAKAYGVINHIQDLLGTHQKEGILLSKSNPEVSFTMGEYDFTCKHDYTLSWTPGSRLDVWPSAGAIVIQTGPKEFYVAGTGVVITFKKHHDPMINVGLLKVDEGTFENHIWKTSRHLNGDQTHQGRHINIPTTQYATQKVVLYDYE